MAAFASPLSYTEDETQPLEIWSLMSYHHAILLAEEYHHSPILLVLQTTELGVHSMAAASTILDDI